MMSAGEINFTELDREAEKIIEEAKKIAENILREAKVKAREKLSAPFPMDEIEKIKAEIIEEANKRASEILKKAYEEAENLKKRAETRYGEALQFLVEAVVGLNE